MRALTYAQIGHGGLTAEELAQEGVGHHKRERSTLEDVQALHAGILIRKAVTSGDLFLSTVPGVGARGAGDDLDGDTPMGKQLKGAFYEDVSRNVALAYRGKNVESRERKEPVSAPVPSSGWQDLRVLCVFQAAVRVCSCI